MTFEADANSYEAAAERKAEQKLLFHPCRRWYADKRNVRLQAAHGLFPAMWMELEAWAGWKSVRKEYLKFQDTGEWAGGFDDCLARLKEDEKFQAWHDRSASFSDELDVGPLAGKAAFAGILAMLAVMVWYGPSAEGVHDSILPTLQGGMAPL